MGTTSYSNVNLTDSQPQKLLIIKASVSIICLICRQTLFKSVQRLSVHKTKVTKLMNIEFDLGALELLPIVLQELALRFIPYIQLWHNDITSLLSAWEIQWSREETKAVCDSIRISHRMDWRKGKRNVTKISGSLNCTRRVTSYNFVEKVQLQRHF